MINPQKTLKEYYEASVRRTTIDDCIAALEKDRDDVLIMPQDKNIMNSAIKTLKRLQARS